MSLDGFSMHPLTRELDTALAGGRIDKITQPNKQSIILSVRQPGQNFLLHISINSQNPSAHLLEKNLENPPEPPVFCMVLRKQIETGRIAQVRQHGLDRLLLIDIDSLAAGGRIVTKTLVLELMGKYSNIILVQDGVIIDALRKIGANSSRVRTVLPGQAYELPPGQEKKDLFTEIVRAAVQAAEGASKNRNHVIPVTIKMRMGIEFGRFSMSCPACMSDRNAKTACLKIFGFFPKVFEFSDRFEAVEFVALYDGNPC